MHITTRDGIKLYSKSTAKSDIRSLRAEGIIRGKIDDIVAILRNVESVKDWVPNLVERTYVENYSDQEAILYDVSDLPWPVTDREMVVHHKLSMGEDNKSLVLNFKSVDHPNKKKDSRYIRAIIHKGRLDFFPKGEKTFVRLTIKVDPMGKIPKFVVNLVQVNMPYDFLMALDKYASKTQLIPLPGLKKMLEKLDRSPL